MSSASTWALTTLVSRIQDPVLVHKLTMCSSDDGFAVQWGSALWGRTGNHDWSCEDLNNANKVMNGYNDVNMAGGYACDGCTEADPTKITRIEVEDTEDRPFTTMKPGVTSFVKTDNGGFDIVTFDEPGGDRLGVVGTCDLIDADAQVVTCGQPLGSRQGIHLFTCVSACSIVPIKIPSGFLL